MKNRISIVIPTFNEEKNISECIESIISQNRKPDEIIVVDDASTDNTLDVLRAYSSSIKAVRKEANTGVSQSVSLGFKEAKGDIVCVIDGDSIAPSDWLEKVEKKFETNGKNLACLGGICKVIQDNESFFKFPNIITNKRANNPTGSGICFNKNICEKINLFDNLPRWGWDTFAPLKLVQEGYTSRKFDDLYVYTHEHWSLGSYIKRGFRYGRGMAWINYFLTNKINKSKFLLSLFVSFSPLILMYLLVSSPIVFIFILIILLVVLALKNIYGNKNFILLFIDSLKKYLNNVGYIRGSIEVRKGIR